MRAVRKIPDHIHDPRGDAQMIEDRAIAKYVFGNTVVYVCDDYLPKTAEEQEMVDRKIVEAAWPIIEELVAKGEAV